MPHASGENGQAHDRATGFLRDSFSRPYRDEAATRAVSHGAVRLRRRSTEIAEPSGQLKPRTGSDW